jgi:MinD-like ATPase involved in chromosome partitioning or flagellar assembly
VTTVVLLAAAGAAWEPEALALLDRSRDVVVLKRCVDVDDLLATAAAGQAGAAVLSADLAGLDADVGARLRHDGVRAVAVVPAGPTADAARARAGRAGLTRVLADDALGGLPALLVADDEPPADEGVGVADPVPRPPARGRVVVVWGPGGAPGRTTVAVGIAAELARRGLTSVLVDADPQGGAVAPLLGVLDEVSGLLSAGRLAAAGELEARLPGVLRTVGPHLGVLTGLPRADRWAELRPGLLTEVAGAARGRGSVVVDTGPSLEDDGAAALGRSTRHQLTLDAVDAADELVVVGTADPVGLSRLARGLVDLRDRTARAPYVVVNRMRPSLGWSEREVAAMLAGVVRTAGIDFLPEDGATVDRAAVAGRTLLEVAPEAALPRALARLVDRFAPPVVGRRAARPARGPRARLLGVRGSRSG